MIRKDHALVFAATLAMVGGYFVVLNPGEADEPPIPPPPNLFTPLDLPDWVDPALPDDTSIQRSRPVSVNFDILTTAQPAEPGGDPPTVPIRFNLFDDVTVTVIFHRAKPRYSIEIPEDPFELLGQEFDPVGYTWSGDIVGEHQGHAVMVTKAGACAVNISVSGAGRFRLRRSGNVHAVREIGGSSAWECGMVDDGSTAQSQGAGGAGAGGSLGCDDGNTIDLVVFYTPIAKATIAGSPWFADIEMEIDIAVSDANAIYRNSAISTTLRLLSKVETNQNEQTGGFPDPWSACSLARPWDGEWDEVHPVRDALRADMVSLIVASGGSYALEMREDSPFSEYRPFSVVQWNDQGEDLSLLLPHELGHNMGCAHDRATDSCTDCAPPCDRGVFPYSFGYAFEAAGEPKLTIMAKGAGTYIDHFSNPNVLFNGQPTGIPAESPNCDSADNALTINTTRTTIANFRESCNTTDTTTMASSDFFNGQGDGPSQSISISDNGQYMAFASDATNLGPSDDNAATDVFVYNRESGVVSPVSLNTDTQTMGNDASLAPAVSGNRRFVAFASDATNLVTGLADDNLATDIYVFELFEPQPFCFIPGIVRMARVSVDSSEAQANGDSASPSISRDGRFVAFASDATDLIGVDGNVATDIFVRDRNADEDLKFDEPDDSTTARVSISRTGVEANGDSRAPAISADGRYVAFESDATNLEDLILDDNTVADIFVRDTAPPVNTIRVSISTAGAEAVGASFAPAISADGRFVVFESDAANLLGPGGDNNGVRDIFVHDRLPVPPQTFRVSVALGGAESNGHSYAAAISDDGRFVAFQSDATNLLGEGVDTNEESDVFVYELATGEIFRASVDSAGLEADAGSFAPAISKDGRFVTFESDGTNLVPGDANGFRDVFFRDRGSMCVGDFNGDFVVDAFDLAILLGAWGPCPEPCTPGLPEQTCPADLDGDCTVGAADLAILLGNWGLCL